MNVRSTMEEPTDVLGQYNVDMVNYISLVRGTKQGKVIAENTMLGKDVVDMVVDVMVVMKNRVGAGHTRGVTEPAICSCGILVEVKYYDVYSRGLDIEYMVAREKAASRVNYLEPDKVAKFLYEIYSRVYYMGLNISVDSNVDRVMDMVLDVMATVMNYYNFVVARRMYFNYMVVGEMGATCVQGGEGHSGQVGGVEGLLIEEGSLLPQPVLPGCSTCCARSWMLLLDLAATNFAACDWLIIPAIELVMQRGQMGKELFIVI